MSTAHLRSIDMNLLPPLKALLEERNVTHAAKRIHLTQSATSRALERLRETLHDDLLVRTRGVYELTPRASLLLQELDLLMPRLEALWTGHAFSPALTQGRIRLAMTDYAAGVILPPLIAACTDRAPGLSIEVSAWHEHAYEDLDGAKIDLLFSPLAVPSTFRIQALFQERFVCLSRKAISTTKRPLTLAAFLEYRHISVETEPKQQNLIDRALAEMGLKRTVALHLPFLLSALRVLSESDLLLTAPLRLARMAKQYSDLHITMAPAELPTFRYSCIWHSRLEREPLQLWFRQLVTEVCNQQVAQEGF